MQLEAAPVEVEVVFLEQSDQTASLCDVAERSDEVGVETQLHGGIRGCTVPARKRLGVSKSDHHDFCSAAAGGVVSKGWKTCKQNL
jgi:hypothetical protein